MPKTTAQEVLKIIKKVADNNSINGDTLIGEVGDFQVMKRIAFILLKGLKIELKDEQIDDVGALTVKEWIELITKGV